MHIASRCGSSLARQYYYRRRQENVEKSLVSRLLLHRVWLQFIFLRGRLSHPILHSHSKFFWLLNSFEEMNRRKTESRTRIIRLIVMDVIFRFVFFFVPTKVSPIIPSFFFVILPSYHSVNSSIDFILYFISDPFRNLKMINYGKSNLI